MEAARPNQLLVVAAIVVALHSCLASLPRGPDFIADVPATPGVASNWILEPSLPIQTDSDTFSWPINFAGDASCRRVTGNISVDLVGLRVPRTADFHVQLLHGARSATLLRGTGTGSRFGSLPVTVYRGTEGATFPARRDPAVYHFQDPSYVFNWTSGHAVEQNWALGRPAIASSTAWGATADRATDAKRDGYMSNNGVFVSGLAEEGIEPWLQVDLGSPRPVGSVHVHDRAVDGDGRGAGQGGVQEVRTVTLAPVPAGSFKLSLRIGASEYTTRAIPLDAWATRRDAAAHSPAGGAVSLQQALEELAPVGNVLVRRAAVPPLGAGAYAWTVTFVERGGLPLLTVTPGSLLLHGPNPSPGLTGQRLHVNITRVRRGRGQVAYMEDGKATTVYHPCQQSALQSLSDSQRCVDAWCGSGLAPGWLLLSHTPLGDRPVQEVLADPALVYKARIPCPAVGQREILLNLRSPVAARYLRIQRAHGSGDRALAVAEVEVFPFTHRGTSTWKGGAEVAPGLYHAAESLGSAFIGSPASGSWVLQFQYPPPSPPASTSGGVQTEVDRWLHSAKASMSTWALHLSCDSAQPDWDGNEEGDEVSAPGRGQDPWPMSAYGQEAGSEPVPARQVRRSVEAGVAVTVHTWPQHSRLALRTRPRSGHEGAYSRPLAGLGAAADVLLSNASGQVPVARGHSAAPLKEAPYSQCPDGATTHVNADGSQSASAQGMFAPPRPVPVGASTAEWDLAVGSTEDRMVELDWVSQGYGISVDPHVSWGAGKALADVSLLPLQGGRRVGGGDATGAEGVDEIVYSARRSDLVSSALPTDATAPAVEQMDEGVVVVHRLQLRAVRRP